jgi:hypothetical protein
LFFFCERFALPLFEPALNLMDQDGAAPAVFERRPADR